MSYKKIRILLIEDEPKVLAFIKQGLEEQDYYVVSAKDGVDGLIKSESGNYDIVIVDLLLPKIHGLEICRQIREKTPRCKILILTALGTLEDKLKGFDSGADDYLVKPFQFPELLARIKSLLRRNSDPQGSHILQVADLTMNLNSKSVSRAGKNIELTAKEFQLLEYLVKNTGRVVSKAEIAEKVWDITFDTGTNVIEVYINFLRKKIDRGFDKNLIVTLIGMGYIIKEA